MMRRFRGGSVRVGIIGDPLMNRKDEAPRQAESRRGAESSSSQDYASESNRSPFNSRTLVTTLR